MEVIREIYPSNYIDIFSENVSPDHVRILVSVLPHLPVSKVVQYIKGERKITRRIPRVKEKILGTTSMGARLLRCNTWTGKHKKMRRYTEKQDAPHKDDTFKVSEF